MQFTVDSRLLRELGERLVGRPHIALAELIKNAYDADASEVTIDFQPDAIIITDDGHGMTRDDFRDRWMRIGSTHKEAQAFSPALHRPLTGSKGVGRLAVQLLADHLELKSRTGADPTHELRAMIDWTEAVNAGLLTTASAEVARVKRTDRPDWSSGVSMTLTKLNQAWSEKEFKSLAEEIWPLQPPFRTDSERDFRVVLVHEDDNVVARFDSQMTAVLDLWTARVIGKLLPPDVQPTNEAFVIDNPDLSPQEQRTSGRAILLRLEFAGQNVDFLELFMGDCHINAMEFEVRIFNLRNRQPFGITVAEARRYLNDYGGVHVYDAGFHLPYYGPQVDWLRIEKDHSHRRGTSDYLPASLQVTGGGEYLPTNSRLYGTVEISTLQELAWAASQSTANVSESDFAPVRERDALRIQVTRDRLADTLAYRNMRSIVRAAIDVYVMKQARLAYESIDAQRLTAMPSPERIDSLTETLDHYRGEIPEPVYRDLSERVQDTETAIRSEYEARNAQVGLLATLATAGVSALAYEHEVSKQFMSLESIAMTLRTEISPKIELTAVADQLDSWIDRARATRALFSPLLEETNRSIRRRLRANEVVREVIEQVRPLARGAEFLNKVDPEIRLPFGTFAEWSALFQNLLINSVNAMLDSDVRKILVSSQTEGESHRLFVQDTGYGIDLAKAPTLFRPFERASRVSPGRARLGLGGTGLGLTIVAMLADELGCSVRFVSPEDQFKTSMCIAWEEK